VLSLLRGGFLPVLLASTGGCSNAVGRVDWSFAFDTSTDAGVALHDRFAHVDVSIRDGRCDGVARYHVFLSSGEAQDLVPLPPDLGPGEYCLLARAIDRACIVYADARRVITLPTDVETYLITFAATAEEPYSCGEEPQCTCDPVS
jgi:hypothetical protein